MTKWMTSGAQRLKANLNRSFIARKNKKASAATAHSNRTIVVARPSKVGATKVQSANRSGFISGRLKLNSSNETTSSYPSLAYADSCRSDRKQSNSEQSSAQEDDVSLPDSFDIERMISLQELRQREMAELAVQERMIQRRKLELEEEEAIMKQQQIQNCNSTLMGDNSSNNGLGEGKRDLDLNNGSFQLGQMPSKDWMPCANEVQNEQEESSLVGVNAMNERLMGKCENAILPRASERRRGTGLQRFQHQDGYDTSRSPVDSSSSSSAETGFKQDHDVVQDSKSTLPPIRYFNNGVEVEISGNPLSNRLQSASNTTNGKATYQQQGDILNYNVLEAPAQQMKKGIAQPAKNAAQKKQVENSMQTMAQDTFKKKDAKRPTKKRKRAPEKLLVLNESTNTTAETNVTASEKRSTCSSSPGKLSPNTESCSTKDEFANKQIKSLKEVDKMVSSPSKRSLSLSFNDQKNTVRNLGGPHGDVLDKLFGS